MPLSPFIALTPFLFLSVSSHSLFPFLSLTVFHSLSLYLSLFPSLEFSMYFPFFPTLCLCLTFSFSVSHSHSLTIFVYFSRSLTFCPSLLLFLFRTLVSVVVFTLLFQDAVHLLLQKSTAFSLFFLFPLNTLNRQGLEHLVFYCNQKNSVV